MSSLFTLAQFVNIPGSFFNRHTNAAVVGNNVGSLVSRLLPNIIVVAGVVFFLMIIYYGFQLIISAGQNKSPQDIARIKGSITYAFIGFLLVVSGYFILQIISTITGVNFINPNVT